MRPEEQGAGLSTAGSVDHDSHCSAIFVTGLVPRLSEDSGKVARRGLR